MEIDDNVPPPPVTTRGRRMATHPVTWNGETIRVAYHPIELPVRPTRTRDPRDERDNPHVHIYLKCALCHKHVKHTSWHPVVQAIETPRGLVRMGGMVCRVCFDHLTSAPRDEFARKRPTRSPSRPVDSDVPLPPEEVTQ